MTEAELKIVRAVAALNVPPHLVSRAAVILMSQQDARPDLMSALTSDVRAHFRVEGAELDACVTACVMLASLQLTGRLPEAT